MNALSKATSAWITPRNRAAIGADPELTGAREHHFVQVVFGNVAVRTCLRGDVLRSRIEVHQPTAPRRKPERAIGIGRRCQHSVNRQRGIMRRDALEARRVRIEAIHTAAVGGDPDMAGAIFGEAGHGAEAQG